MTDTSSNEPRTVAFDLDGSSVELDTNRAAITRVTAAGYDLVAVEHATSLLRLAIPVEGYAAHWVEVGGSPSRVERDGGTVRMVFDSVQSQHADLPVHVDIDATPTADGLVLRARIRNDSDLEIPQVVFPQLTGLVPRAPQAPMRLQLAGRCLRPFEELVMRPDDLSFLEVPLQEYIYYGSLDMTMKWLDVGDADAGLTVYGRSSRYTTQGLLAERPDRDAERLNLRWAHYPPLAPGQSWDSEDVVLLPHAGDWYAGADAYRGFVVDRYPYRAPKRIREALAIRSIWPAVRNTPPTFRFDEIPEYAAEVADPELGVGEVVLWHWWLKNGYPIVIDDRLGNEADLRTALAACRHQGVAMSLFVSHHILRDSDETDPDWLHRNKTGRAVVWNWTYSSDYVPKFPVLFAATHSMVKASALSPAWRKTGLEEYRRIMNLGAESICFDVYYSWIEPNYSASADGPADAEGEALIAFGEAAREIIHAERPEGSFSGEWPSDLKVPVMDYTWDWRNAYDVAACAPFRYVFPQFRLNANVGAHPRGPVVAFMEAALLNLMPGGLKTQRLSDHPELLELLRGLNRLRRQFLPFFTEGRFRHLEASTVTGGDARVYTHDGDVLVIAANPSDEEAQLRVRVDLVALGMGDGPWSVSAHDLSGACEDRGSCGAIFEASETLAPDGLVVLQLRCGEPPP